MSTACLSHSVYAAIAEPVSNAKTVACVPRADAGSDTPERRISEKTAATITAAPTMPSALGRSPRSAIAAVADSSGPVPRASG